MSQVDASVAPSAQPVNPRSRVILASLIGTSIEFYDFYVYATAAVLVFPILFFPSDNAVAAQLASFAAFGVAFIARPIGSILFGHFGDRIGRKGTLVASLLTMGIATFIIGILPTALTPGWHVLAPALLVLMRRASASAGSGAEPRCSPPRTPPRASAPSTAPSRSWAPRSASSSPTACSSSCR
jgi:MFS family permease